MILRITIRFIILLFSVLCISTFAGCEVEEIFYINSYSTCVEYCGVDCEDPCDITDIDYLFDGDSNTYGYVNAEKHQILVNGSSATTNKGLIQSVWARIRVDGTSFYIVYEAWDDISALEVYQFGLDEDGWSEWEQIGHQLGGPDPMTWDDIINIPGILFIDKNDENPVGVSEIQIKVIHTPPDICGVNIN